ncbi:type II toxin-antitoxin system RelE/ParE family toxin [Pendulispora albinea]|uniref:Type II toxin-antitoxin system RelE/ParE family toxin n=1 Tax=Pendulispora albinea TaxID=2741071 RepID=A0ABZ2LPD1_9BACT
MPWSLEYTTRAAKYLQSLPDETGRRLLTSIETLCDNPRPKGSRRRRNTANVFYVHAHVDAATYFIGYEIRERRVVIIVLDVFETSE